MSKKKSSGNTMTLKDFHGGSIPSDLHLPSAPGVTPRSTTDRPGFDRAPWGTSMARSDQRTRPSSSHSIKNFDDKTPFLPHTANIGRNFSEDERKPLDSPSAPRRMVSDDVFPASNNHLDVKLDSVLAGRLTSWQGVASPWSVKKIDAVHSGTCNKMVGGNSENSMSGAYPNAWASRREVTPPSSERGQSTWAIQSASKLVHVTAIDQVSSGRWHSRLAAPGQMENLKHSEMESGLHKNTDHVLERGNMAHERESSDSMIARRMEKGLGIEDGILGGKKVSPVYEKGPASAYAEVKYGNVAANSNNRLYPNRSDAKCGVSVVQPTVPSETAERPKLKLLPRTKPLENFERPLSDAKQESGTSIAVQFETGTMTQESMNTSKSGSSADETERPKLNLKPISQLLEQPNLNPERERNAVFGGARPRELVLKERGLDDSVHHELEQQLERINPNAPKTERIPEQAILSRPAERPANISRTVKIDKKDNRNVSNTDRSETQRRNWRNNMRGNDRQTQLSTQEKRHPSPESWRKPVETQKAESIDGNGQRYGKAASALELAQAFSKPFSDFNDVKRGFSGRDQVPFSRLIGSTARQINGY